MNQLVNGAVQEAPVEQDSLAETLCQIRKLDQTLNYASATGTGSPKALAVAANIRGSRNGLVR